MPTTENKSSASFTVPTAENGNVTVLVAQVEEISQHGAGTRLIVNGKEIFSPDNIDDVKASMDNAA